MKKILNITVIFIVIVVVVGCTDPVSPVPIPDQGPINSLIGEWENDANALTLVISDGGVYTATYRSLTGTGQWQKDPDFENVYLFRDNLCRMENEGSYIVEFVNNGIRMWGDDKDCQSRSYRWVGLWSKPE